MPPAAFFNFLYGSPGVMRRLLPILLVGTLVGCASSNDRHARQLFTEFEEKHTAAGDNRHLYCGVPLDDAVSYRKRKGFEPDQRATSCSSLPAWDGSTAHYVKRLPFPNRLVVIHPEIHVVLLHDGQTVKDIKSELIHSAQ